tara:strand:+ start:1387 stop:1977 length:591 start_codon:yes stop_codon:yes gene_type:complete
MNNLASKIVGVLFLSTILVLWWCKETTAGDLVHKFKSPSFSGVGTSAHFLTIENQEFTRKAEIKAKKIAAEEKELSAKRNTNFRKFLDNFESRIYAEFSKQLADAMFGEACGTHYNDAGTAVAPTAEVMEGGASTTNDTQTLHADAGGGTSCSGTMTFNGTTMTYTKDLAADQVVLQIDGPDGNETITLPLNDFQF